MPTSNVQTVSQ